MPLDEAPQRVVALTATLNYSPSRSAVYYKPPMKVLPGRALAGFIVAALGVVIGAAAMAIRPLVNRFLITSGEAEQLKQVLKRIAEQKAPGAEVSCSLLESKAGNPDSA